MKQVLVTGGAGLIGAGLCERLLQDGFKVTCIDNFITSSKQNIINLLADTNFTLVEHDITNQLPEKVINTKFETIYHLACPTGVPNLTKLSLEMLRTCSIGTENILELALKHKAKLVFTSSSEVYGDPLVFPQSEDYTGNVDPVGIRSPYEEGKRYAESLVISYVRRHNLDAKIVRLFNTYGPKQFDDTRVITRFMKAAADNKPIPVEGRGEQTRTFCYVDDLVNALLIINEKGTKGEIYNAGSDTEISILELANLVKFATGSKSKIAFIPRPPHDHKRRQPDLSKLKSLGWRQNVGIYEGLKRL
jgi:nucleoside-diphosphate-sugar epimerase